MDSTTAIFSLQWESQTEKDLFVAIGKAITAAAVQGVVTYYSGPLSRIGTAILASQCAFEFKTIQKLFQKAKLKAKWAGKLLACALALHMPFKTQTVSLIGFSLGTQVIKSCLKTLHEIYEYPCEPPLGPRLAPDIIQSVTLLGGACHFSKNKRKYKEIFLYIVNGSLKNVYSRNDRILYLYMVSELCLNSIGRNPITLTSERLPLPNLANPNNSQI